MIVLSGADLVLPGGVQPEGTLVIEGERIGAIGAMGALGATGASGALGALGAETIDLRGHIIVPGFIDVHVHGLDGLDTLDGGDVIAAIAERLPKFGVTAFCPTTVACAPRALRDVLRSVASMRGSASFGPMPEHGEVRTKVTRHKRTTRHISIQDQTQYGEKMSPFRFQKLDLS